MSPSTGKWGNGIFSRVDLVNTQQSADSWPPKALIECFLGDFSFWIDQYYLVFPDRDERAIKSRYVLCVFGVFC